MGDAQQSEEAPAPVEPAATSIAAMVVPFDFEAVILRHESPLLRYVTHLLAPGQTQLGRRDLSGSDSAGGASATAPDIVQETFLRLHVHVRKHGPDSIEALPAWLSRVAHNLAMDHLRKVVRQRALHAHAAEALRHDDRGAGGPGAGPGAGASPPTDGIEQQELHQRALAELNRLDDDQRHLILLRLIQGLTFKEISQVTGLTIGNIGYRINQGLREMARRLKEQDAI
ncbi:MAG: sigma-70 family RNA polymerase sigma factor [Phycisphaeraceae bacterium]